MFQTATVTDLRFKTKEIWDKSGRNPVWIFKKGKKGRIMIDAHMGEQLLELRQKKIIPKKVRPGTPSLLDEIKKYQFKGPKDLSLRIDEYVYGTK